MLPVLNVRCSRQISGKGRYLILDSCIGNVLRELELTPLQAQSTWGRTRKADYFGQQDLHHAVVSLEIGGIEFRPIEIIQKGDAEYAREELVEDCPEQNHLRWSYGQF